jgi:hypothetical protein
MVGEAINFIHHSVLIWPQVTTEKRLAGHLFHLDFEVMQARRAWLQAQGTQFFQDGINKLVYWWDKCLNTQGDYMET